MIPRFDTAEQHFTRTLLELILIVLIVLVVVGVPILCWWVVGGDKEPLPQLKMNKELP